MANDLQKNREASTARYPARLRIFLAGPGDVTMERVAANSVVERLNADPLVRERFHLELITWGRTRMRGTMTPQQAISEGLPPPSQCDIVIVAFWARMGTPLPASFALKDDGTTYQSGTEWEFWDAATAASETGVPELLLYRRSEDIFVRVGDETHDEQLRQKRMVDQFFGQFISPDGALTRGVNYYEKPSEFESALDSHLREYISERILDADAGSTRAPDPDLPLPRPERVFPGLRAYDASQHAYFFGREREVEEVLQRLAATEFVVVVGASGSGKSSLVCAGVIPRLVAGAVQDSDYWRWIRVTPGALEADPMLGLVSAFANQFKDRAWELTDVRHRLTNAPDALIDDALEDDPATAKLVIFIDQLEEIFTAVAIPERDTFLQLLCSLSALERIKVVTTVRADYYAACLDHASFASIAPRGTYPLGAPGVAALHRIVTQPASMVRVKVESALVERILYDIGTASGILPLLSFVLAELISSRPARGELTLSEYESFGGLLGALSRRAEDTLETLGEAGLRAFPKVFQSLVHIDDSGLASRARIIETELLHDPDCSDLIEAFVTARLLVRDSEVGHSDVFLSVAHEALFYRWFRLHEWIDAHRGDVHVLSRLASAVTQWQDGDEDIRLRWPIERIEEAIGAAKKLDYALSDHARAFLQLDYLTAKEQLELEFDETNPVRRWEIGRRWGERGDARYGVGCDSAGVPEIRWCSVPAGSIALPRRDGQLEDSVDTVAIPAFQIAAFPVTESQFSAFYGADDGYGELRWWAAYWASDLAQPGWVSDQLANAPVVKVSWIEAMAYCGWLSKRLGFTVDLPTEWEWQLAAGGEAYPWGKHWDDGRLYQWGTGSVGAVPVGLYPSGASPGGVFDMLGNTWEWCANAPMRPYEVDLSAGGFVRSIRGSSWLKSPEHPNCNLRGRANVTDKLPYIGFRLVTRSRTTSNDTENIG